MDVLIVEDDVLVRWDLADTLRDAGVRTAEAGNAFDALRILYETESPPRVLITDIDLGNGLDGRRLGAEAMRCWPLFVVYLTGYPVLVTSPLLGPRELSFLKPFDRAAILFWVQKLLAMPMPTTRAQRSRAKASRARD